MKKLLLSLTLSVLLGLPIFAALRVADRAPDFPARASLAGKEFNFSLEDALKKGPVVVYFYPSAYTKGCDLEAHTFADMKDQLHAAPIYCAEMFPGAPDGSHKIAESYNLTTTALKAGATDVRGVAIDHDF